jgi:Putative amidoligase enzyme
MAQVAPLVPADPEFAQPPIMTAADGRMRTIGVEIEFAGPTAEETARAIAAELGGQILEEDPHAFRIKDTKIGDISVELDSRFLHPEKKRTLLGGILPRMAAWFGSAASLVIPCELVTAPVPIDRLHEVEDLIPILRGIGAKGTQDAPVYAFGLHFNPEIPRQDAETAAAFLKSFVLLDGWLRRQVAPDATRHLLGFADPFPPDYVRMLVSPDYWPDLTTFIADYLHANPTRNRDLDMLPLLLHLDEARVRAALPNEKINGRPTFHYRLPDARVSDPGWRIAPDWNRWVAVERLAADRALLNSVGESFLAFRGEEKSWVDTVERIAHP